MTGFNSSILGRGLRWLAREVVAHPAWFVTLAVLLFVLSVFYTSFTLKLDMNRNRLVGPQSMYYKISSTFQKEFSNQDNLVVLVESSDRDINRQFVERLGAKLRSETNLFKNLFYKADITTLGAKGLLLAPVKDLKQMRQALRDNLPFIQELTQTTNLNSLVGLINRQFLSGYEGTGASRQSLLNELPALESLLSEARQSLLRPGTPVPPEVEALLGGTRKGEQSYITYEQGQMYLLTVQPRTEALTAKAIVRMRQLIQQTKMEVPGENVGLTGQPVLDYDEMRQAERDTTLASIVALVLCSLLFIFAYGEVGRPIAAAVCLLVGLGYTMGFATLAIGHLNILTITFAPMLIGLAIDYGIHFMSRYEEERVHNRTKPEAIGQASVFTGQGIFVGAFTTAAAFFAMALTNFKGIQEMGIISGGGLIICLIPMLALLPILLVRIGQKKSEHKVQKRLQAEKTLLQRPWRVVVLVMVVCAAAIVPIHRIYFDYDLLHMQSPRLPSVYYEGKLIHAGTRSALFATVMADDLQQAQLYKMKLKTLPSVAGVESAADFVTPDQPQKLQLIRGIKQEVQGINFRPIDRGPVEIVPLQRTLFILEGYLGLAEEFAQNGDRALARQLGSLREAVAKFYDTILGEEPDIPERLAPFQQVFLEAVRRLFEAIKTQDTQGPMQLQDLPPFLRERFVGFTGKLLLQVYPKKDVWEHVNQREFVQQLRSVIPEERIDGPPVKLYEYTTLLKASYQEAAVYALVAIVVMLFLYFRSVSAVILALLPVAVGSIWLLGFMGLTNIPFNPANIMTLPLVIGIGVNNGIQILNRLVEEQTPEILSKSTGKAVLVSGLTSAAGFGSLILAKHQGIHSLGVIMSVGIASCLVASLTLLPALLHILMRRGWTIQPLDRRVGVIDPK